MARSTEVYFVAFLQEFCYEFGEHGFTLSGELRDE
jgi:hypothetical protein